MTIDMCDPKTWPGWPLLAIRRKDTGAKGTLMDVGGQPRNVIHETCAKVRAMIDRGGDPLTELNGSDELTCENVADDWEVDASNKE